MSKVGFIVVAFFVSVLIHAYFARWLMRSFNVKRRTAIAVAAGLIVLSPLGRVVATFTHAAPVVFLQTIALTELFGMAICVTPLFLIEVAASFVPERVSPRAPLPVNEEPAEEEPFRIGRREAIERAGGLAIFGAAGIAAGWGSIKGRHAFTIDEVVVKIPGLPRLLDGYTIAQISDVHTGTFVKEDELRLGFDFINRVKPDLIVATGDIVDSYSEYAKMFARLFADLKSRDGSYAILGNHDYYSGANEVVSAMRSAGVNVLINEGVLLRGGDQKGFALLGVDDLWARRVGGVGPDLDRALSKVPSDVPRILLAHQPKYFDQAAGRVALQLSGHTHGGQINPGFRPADILMDYVAGRYEKNGTSLWVNRGFGVAGPPVRLGAPPEITKIVLVSG